MHMLALTMRHCACNCGHDPAFCALGLHKGCLKQCLGLPCIPDTGYFQTAVVDTIAWGLQPCFRYHQSAKPLLTDDGALCLCRTTDAMAVWRIKAGAAAIETELMAVHEIIPPDQAATVNCVAGSGCAALDAVAGAHVLYTH